MGRCNNHLNLCIIFLFGLILISGCEEQSIQATGFLKGLISIGPLCPVENDPPDPGCLPTAETYKAYPVSIWTSDGRRKITQLEPALDGSYKIDLDPGMYLVVLETGQNSIGSSNLPREVTITSKTNTVLNIEIDTGIR